MNKNRRRIAFVMKSSYNDGVDDAGTVDLSEMKSTNRFQIEDTFGDSSVFK